MSWHCLTFCPLGGVHSTSLALYHKGKLLNSLGRYNESIDFLDKAFRLDPSNGEYIYERNRAYGKLGRSIVEETPICGVGVSKVSYRSGETTTIYYAIGIPAMVQITVIKPDGATYTYGPAYLNPGIYSVNGRANAPLGMRKVVLVASGEQTCSSICYFNVY
jgi:tetratricopeptide (TPR) repeat protein